MPPEQTMDKLTQADSVFIYDPTLIRPEDLTYPKPGKLIPLKNNDLPVFTEFRLRRNQMRLKHPIKPYMITWYDATQPLTGWQMLDDFLEVPGLATCNSVGYLLEHESSDDWLNDPYDHVWIVANIGTVISEGEMLRQVNGIMCIPKGCIIQMRQLEEATDGK